MPHGVLRVRQGVCCSPLMLDEVYGCMLRDRLCLCRITLSRKHLSLFILPTADGNYSRLADALRFIDSVVIVHQNHIYLSK